MKYFILKKKRGGTVRNEGREKKEKKGGKEVGMDEVGKEKNKRAFLKMIS